MTDLVEALRGKVWHATDVASFEAIVADGRVRAMPPVNRNPNSFCQHLKRISLFDFREAPDLMTGVERSDWISFTSIPPDDMAVWLRIDPECIRVPTTASLNVEWSAAEAAGLFKGGNHTGFIQHLETGYSGDIPTSAVVEDCYFSWLDFSHLLSGSTRPNPVSFALESELLGNSVINRISNL